MLIVSLLISSLVLASGAISAAQQRCAKAGDVTTVFEGIDVNRTPTLLKSIRRQLEVAFFLPSNQLQDKTIVANGQAALKNNHSLGVRFNPAFDNALSTLTEEIVNAQLSTAETQFKAAFGRNLQYVLFAYGTPDWALKLAEKRAIRVVQHNIDFSDSSVSPINTLDANFVDPKHQSFITLQNAHGESQWSILQQTYNAAVARSFQPVRLSTCLPPLRESGVEGQSLVVVNPAPQNPPPTQPQPLTTAASSAASLHASWLLLSVSLLGLAFI